MTPRAAPGRRRRVSPGPVPARLGFAWMALVLGLTGCEPPSAAPTARPWPHEAYVWQRTWTSNVTAALSTRGPEFERLVVLGAEIAWREGQPRTVKVPLDPSALRATGRPIGVALRVGPFSGPFGTNDDTARLIRATAHELLATLQAAQINPAEFQVDFDCAESRLAGYRVWLDALRQDVRPVPLTFTALPSWLDRPAFTDLVRAADGYVLQVHSVERPRRPDDPFQLCDPAKTRRWVAVAGRLGRPFRVALPTYGYLVAFGLDGKFLGASAEGLPPERPPGTTLRELSADPVALAGLVEGWRRQPPAHLEGVIWYRLPVDGDRLNWRWPTLTNVMAGRVPQARLTAVSRQPQPGLTEIDLRNEGTADRTGPVAVRVRWQDDRRVAHDAIRGFTALMSGADEMLFTNSICRLPAGDTVTIGWLRLERGARVDVTTNP